MDHDKDKLIKQSAKSPPESAELEEPDDETAVTMKEKVVFAIYQQ